MRALVWLVLVACGGSGRSAVEPPQQPSTTPTDEEQPAPLQLGRMPCAARGLYHPHARGIAYHAPKDSEDWIEADAAAHADHDRGMAAYEAGRFAEAASHFLSCGQQYAKVPDGDAQRPRALQTAKLCFENAATAYAAGGQFEAVGRGKLDASAQSDARMRPIIDEILASPPPDCTS